MSSHNTNHAPRKPDADILHDVARELSWDTRVSPTEIGIQVNHGVVTFHGNGGQLGKLRAGRTRPIASPVSSTSRTIPS